MNKTLRAAIERHAVAVYPAECCGLVIRGPRRREYVPCRNTAATPDDQFRIAPEDYAAAEDRGQVLAVVHSHPDWSSAPSEADRACCEASGLPWYIVEVRRGDDGEVRAGELSAIEPEGYLAPLVGRPFTHGVHDCYALVRDFYAREMGITLPDYPREDGWWNRGEDLYYRYYKEAGFYEVATPQHGDVIVMQIRAPQANHAGVYLADGKLGSEPDHYPTPGVILHHLHGKDARRDVYGGDWALNTRLILRHKDAPA
ncbi:C40 family peptidase [Pseudomonas nitroreducens]|uniref:C40 family peptidase n=1 Tax=Pseudomonas nitroreducens TaxID=46680 RepID=UPI002659FF2C|nr:C40 family peptidase [Pseudomonas nitroreducens]MCP1652735.1 proteasome lid subunit RPN8/RPN11 [Pseudomonas nitroreducens]